MRYDPGEFAPEQIRLLVFDVFGTVVSYHEVIAEALAKAVAEVGATVPSIEAMIWQWRAGDLSATAAVNAGERPWADLEELRRDTLEKVLADHRVSGVTADRITKTNHAWRQLEPWPDSVPGLLRLRNRYVLGTLSNGSVPMLVDMAKHGGLPWDVVLSADMVRRFKPDPAVYELAPRLLKLPAEQVMMVAAHPADLNAARTVGLRTAYVHRPLESGVQTRPHAVESQMFDVNATDLIDLAEQLNIPQHRRVD